MRRVTAWANVAIATLAAVAILPTLGGCASRGSSSEPAGASERAARGASSAQGFGTSTSLGGAAARVGAQPIDAELVARVARAQGLPAAAAARTLIDEALVAEAAVRAGALRDPNVLRQIEASYARALVSRERAAALATGPFTDQELAAAMGDEWVDLDAPETRVVVHALIPKDVADGAGVAAAMRARLVTAKDAAAFLEAAKAFGVERGVRVVAESLEQPFTDTGAAAVRGANGGGFDPAFAKAAFAIARAGECSAVVETPFGWHVIHLVTIQPERRASREAKIKALEPVLVKNRAFGAFQARLGKLREGAHEATTASSGDLAAPRFSAPELPR